MAHFQLKQREDYSFRTGALLVGFAKVPGEQLIERYGGQSNAKQRRVTVLVPNKIICAARKIDGPVAHMPQAIMLWS